MKKFVKIFFAIALVIFCFGMHSMAEAVKFNVLVVMSYEKPNINPWCKEIKEGIDSVLGDTCSIDYFYLNTKIDFDGGKQKAKEIYVQYKKNRYDGVIAVDDNAQKMFVLPYLKNSVKTPVMFCGVNAEAKKYGYPAANVSGILERGHFRESIAFVKQLIPRIDTIGFVVKESPSGKALKIQIENKSTTYLAKVGTFELEKTLQDIANSEKLKACDVFLVASLRGIRDNNGKLLSIREIISFITDTFNKPVVGTNNAHVRSGALCAVVKSGQEQGEGATAKLHKAMQGTPLSKIPVTRNYKGKRVINVTAMKKFGLEPRPMLFLGATLVKTEAL